MSGRRPLGRGDVVLVRFPFTDLAGQKLRPALVVGRPADEDLVLAFMTSRVELTEPHAEHLLAVGDPEFRLTGLRTASLIRLNQIATLHRSLIHRRLGTIGPETDQFVRSCLRYVFGRGTAVD